MVAQPAQAAQGTPWAAWRVGAGPSAAAVPFMGATNPPAPPCPIQLVGCCSDLHRQPAGRDPAGSDHAAADLHAHRGGRRAGAGPPDLSPAAGRASGAARGRPAAAGGKMALGTEIAWLCEAWSLHPPTAQGGVTAADAARQGRFKVAAPTRRHPPPLTPPAAARPRARAAAPRRRPVRRRCGRPREAGEAQHVGAVHPGPRLQRGHLPGALVEALGTASWWLPTVLPCCCWLHGLVPPLGGRPCLLPHMPSVSTAVGAGGWQQQQHAQSSERVHTPCVITPH